MVDLTLSIVIPTKNRVNFLKETLESILENLNEEIEIVVVDGGSNDGTNSLMIDFLNQYNFINYIKIVDLLGFDAELDLGVLASKGKYTWIFSDDDIVHGKDINHIVKYLNTNNKIELLLVNSSIWTLELDFELQNKFVIRPDMRSNNMDLLFENFIDYLTFLGGCIIKRDKWISASASKYFGTLFVHVGVIFSHKSLNWHWLEKPIISIRYGNASWSAKSQEIWLNKWPNLLDSFENVSKTLRDRKVKISGFSFFKKLVFFKAINFFNPNASFDYNQVNNLFVFKSIVCLVNKLPRIFCYYLSLFFAIISNKPVLLADLKSAKK